MLRRAMARFQSGAIDVDALLRAMISTDVLFAPATDRDYELRPVTSSVPGGRRFDFYTAEAHCPATLCMAVDPADELRALSSSMVQIYLDRGRSDAVFFGPDQVPAMRQWGRVGQVEQWCATGAVPWGPDGLLKGFESFLVLIDKAGDPLYSGENLLRFTAPDALAAWLRAHPGGEPCALAGPDLAGVLDLETPVRVNPAGPGAPMSVPRSLRERLPL